MIMVEIKMPDLGQTITELEIIKWHKKVGDAIKKGDILVEVQTDKAIAEVESFADGTLEEIRFKEGKVEVGQIIAIIK
jgi:pyruvate/2-oxoglutarate dehydrogenase complex dihydrolipoamide acyltransferase (E2) component